MKLFLSVLILFLSIQSLINADDIKDFEIEGMSIGDSALDFFSEQDIKKNSKDYYRDKTFTPVQNDQYPFFKIFDAVDFNFKTGDKKYIFHNINGILYYDNDIENCYLKMDDITNDIEKNITYKKKHLKQVFKHRADKTGKSKFTQTRFDLMNGYILIICYDFSKEFAGQDHMSVSIDTKEFNDWVMSGIF